MFPAAFIQNAAYEATLRVQSERSERLRELTPAARRRSERLRELTPAARRRSERLRELPSAGTHRCLTKREENGIIEYIKKQGGLKL